MYNERTVRFSIADFFALTFTLALFCLSFSAAAEPEFPDVLPPPPELLNGIGVLPQAAGAKPPAPAVDSASAQLVTPQFSNTTAQSTSAHASEPSSGKPAAASANSSLVQTITPSVSSSPPTVKYESVESWPPMGSVGAPVASPKPPPFAATPFVTVPLATTPAPGYESSIVYTAPDPVDPMFTAPQVATPQVIGSPITIQVAGGGVVSRGIVMSPPSSSMPADYFNLPLGENDIPGVLIPEMEYESFDAAPASPARQVSTGMSIRQLEPYFALAKGSEGAALEAKNKNNDAVYFDQLAKSRDAYMEIVKLADAGNEAREEAWYGVARCEYRLGNWWQSFDALERSFPEKFVSDEVAGRIKLEQFIGERLWGYGQAQTPGAVVDGVHLNGYMAAAKVYKALIHNQPENDKAPLALLRQGDAASFNSDWASAAKFYRQLVEYYPDSEPAMQGRSSLAEAIYRQEWPTGFPEAARKDAHFVMEDVERADAAALSPEAADRRRRAVEVANDLDAETKLRHAKEYLKSLRMRKSRAGAVFMLKDIVTLYPGTKQANEASEILASLGEAPPASAPVQAHSPFSQPNTYGADDAKIDYGFGADPFASSSITLDRDPIPSTPALPASPSRETIYESLPDPVFVE